jgi:galactokinase
MPLRNEPSPRPESAPRDGPRTFRAPGRVTLIGERADDNVGYVLPFATDLEIRVTATPRSDRAVRSHSLATRSSAEFGLDDRRVPHEIKSWIDYVRGIAFVLSESGHTLRGADLLIESTLPMDAGLSSSAALSIASGWALLALAGAEVDRLQLVHAARLAEERYVGVRSGIVDPYASAFGLRDHALLIDSRSIQSQLVPVPTHAAAFVVCDTRERSALAETGYAERRAECEEAVGILRRSHPGIRALRDVDFSDLVRANLPATLFRRCRHVVTENARALAAAEALRSGDLAQMGWLMRQSHESLRVDYEMSTDRIDALVAVANDFRGIYGSRITGAGFGGSTIHLADPASVERFQPMIEGWYRDLFGETLDVRVLYPSDGAGEVEYSA